MIFPAIDKLLTVVGSKYELVHIVALRSREMHDMKNYQLPENEYKSSKNIGKAMEEIEKNLINVKNNFQE